jgi:hypothetical protein
MIVPIGRKKAQSNRTPRRLWWWWFHSLGLSFNNFSARNLFNKNLQILTYGDGQRFLYVLQGGTFSKPIVFPSLNHGLVEKTILVLHFLTVNNFK